jgi:prepilin-type processing-associated H-X9-DG protein
VLAYLLPYMEQGNVYNLVPRTYLDLNTTQGAWAYNTPPYDVDSGVPSAYVNYTGYPHWADTRIPSFECPSDSPYSTLTSPDDWVIDAFYVQKSSGSYYIDYVFNYPGFGREMGAGNYIGCAGYASDYTGTANSRLYKGVYHAGSQTKVASISDGTSNTIAFGEVASGKYYNSKGQFVANFRVTWVGAGSMSTYTGLQTRGARPAGSWDPFQFSSRHSAGINFAFCDGSVRTISRNVDNNTFWGAGGPTDGVVNTLPYRRRPASGVQLPGRAASPPRGPSDFHGPEGFMRHLWIGLVSAVLAAGCIGTSTAPPSRPGGGDKVPGAGDKPVKKPGPEQPERPQ